MPRKSSAKKAPGTPGKKLTKAAFVRSQPATMPAKDVVAAGVAAGLKFSEKYVYNTRSTARSKPAKRGVPARFAKAAGAAPAANGSSEAAFRKLVLDIGLGRAKSLLADVEGKLSALIAGR